MRCFPAVLRSFRSSTVLAALLATAAALLLPTVATAQPFGSWGIFDRDDPGNYFQIPDDPALTPATQITLEGWVDVSDPGGCSNIIGKGWQTSWWVGICNGTLRSYLRGSTSSRTGGSIGQPGWHHFAVTFDGSQRCHYIVSPRPTPSSQAVLVAARYLLERRCLCGGADRLVSEIGEESFRGS